MRKLNLLVNRIFRFNEKSHTLVSTYSLFPAVPCLLQPLSQLTFVTAFRSLTSSHSHCRHSAPLLGSFLFPSLPTPSLPSLLTSTASATHPRTVAHTATRGRGQNQQAIKQNLILPGVPTLTLISRPCSSSPILLSFLCWLQHTDTFL